LEFLHTVLPQVSLPGIPEASMKFSRLINICLVLSLSFFVFACSGKPVDYIDKTEKAMQQAKDEHADDFATEEWKSAEESMNAAQSLLDKEKWGEATTALLRAKARFEKARDIAKGRRAAAIQEIEGTQKTAEMRCKTLKEALDANSKKLSAAKRKEFEDACKSAEEKLAKVSTQLESGQYGDAKLLAGSTLREVWEAQKELDGLVGKKK
jgi:predicted HNH restriction endonuclease